MDTLLGDQDSLNGEQTSSQGHLQLSIRGENKSLCKSLDNYSPNSPTTPKNIKFHINSEDEEEDVIGGEYTNMDFGFNDDDEPEPNQDYLLASIFSKQRATPNAICAAPAVKPPLPKPNPINTSVQPSQAKPEQLVMPQTPSDTRLDLTLSYRSFMHSK